MAGVGWPHFAAFRPLIEKTQPPSLLENRLWLTAGLFVMASRSIAFAGSISSRSDAHDRGSSRFGPVAIGGLYFWFGGRQSPVSLQAFLGSRNRFMTNSIL
jgi:hypothetical protein